VTATELSARAAELRALHVPGDPLVLVNVWDVASARTVASVPDCRAIATASWSIAAAHGYADGERIPLQLMLAAVERIAAAVELPVTADLESGFGEWPEQVAETVAGVIEAGAVGANLEDRLRPVAEHVAVVAAVRRRAEREGVPFVINARSDEYLLGERRLETAIESGRAYAEAGADCVFVPGIRELDEIERLVRELDVPVNVLAAPGLPSLAELAAVGVARVSFGPGPLGVASAALAAAAERLLARGDYPAELGHRPPAG
jgi:2-methylisocitrate lyase-like PEP mutase family enzyme